MWEADQKDKKHQINCAEYHTENLHQQLNAWESQIIELIIKWNKYQDAFAEIAIRIHGDCRTTPVPD